MSGVFHGILASLAGVVRDTFFKYVTLLLPGNGTNLAQNNTFIDSSTYNQTITRNGNTTQGTFSPYGSNWSNFFDGSGDYFTVPNNSAYALGNLTWTIEAWFFVSVATQYQCIGGQGDSVGLARSFLLYATDNTGKPMISIQYSGGTINLTSSTAAATNTWNHIAAVRNGNTMTLYLNGNDVGSTNVTGVTVSDPGTPMTIGRSGDYNGEYINGYVSNFRIVNDNAIYTSNFTPPTSPLTAVSGTNLLTCQSNRFVDRSTNNFTITRYGDVSVQDFDPFGPSAAYSSSVIGGSGYFDGTGDYLTTPAGDAYQFGTGNFTIEAWVNLTGAGSGDRFIVDQANGTQYVLRYNSAGVLQFYISSSLILSQTTSLSNSWNHVVVVRSGTTISLFLNGLRVNTTTNNSSVGSNTDVVGIGAKNTGGDDFWQGYISSLRIVKGTAVYDPTLTTLTIPTAPLTAITNTSLLLNFTNAGIIDNSMMNDLETVGDVKISTTQSKFGGSSIYFDGATGYLKMPTSPQFGFNTGNFTIEAWIYPTGFGGTNSVIIDFRSGVEPSVKPDWEISSSGVILYRVNGSTVITGSTLSTNTWYHVALCRSSGTTRMFVNGTQVGSNYTDANNYGNTSRCYIGIDDDGGPNAYYSGYIDDLRITKSIARYTANFTPPDQPLPLS